MSDCNVNTLTHWVTDSADDLKGKDIKVLDVKDKATFTDVMVFVTGTSIRHVKSIAQAIAEKAKKEGCPALGVEGEVDADWILVDLGDVVAHVMTEQGREFYQLEELWGAAPKDAST